MSNLSQQKNLLKSPHHASTQTKPKPNMKQLVLNQSPGPLASARVTTIKALGLDYPSLKSTWAHRAWLAGGCTAVLISLAKSIAGAADSHLWVEPVLAALVGYLLADLVTGVYHWAIDNYGNPTTPIFGPQIEASERHHKWPWAITHYQLAKLVHTLARPITFTVLPLNLVLNDPTQMAFIGSFSGCIMFSLKFHAWAHTTKSKLPPIVVGLQDLGVLLSRSQHDPHHHPLHNSKYCLVSGIWNKFLDENKVFEVLEMVLFRQLGVRPRSWSDPSSKWIEDNSIPSSDGVPK